ncbi:rho guanine nucleotide exchange factor 2 isoform X3 [Halyomorpha halys]|uniref:rho guanine nucleotide exchange factor 2 isoform X3 n=1 Tax=Halyomorpha halys TaxID=286706 RepID=UPI0006D5117E|nr:rho guanine nucleotide exchange factor 18 isoform X3 [Halyomorpha halys]
MYNDRIIKTLVKIVFYFFFFLIVSNSDLDYECSRRTCGDEWCGESIGSEEDLITDYIGSEEMSEKQGTSGPSPLVPTISVTPHSPAGKHYPILEDNLQQLHYIHESVQQMRELIVQPVSSQEASRLSASCPSLNDAGSDPDLLSSLNSTPTQTLTLTTPAITRSVSHKRGSGEWELYRRNMGLEGDIEVSRRRSWAALEDLTHCKDSTKAGRQRSGNDLCSISLSSMESDMDDPFCESTTNLLGTNEVISRVRQTRTHANSSTHSLNEAELQNDFKKVVSKREAETRLLNARLSSPLQKSVSTPSIIAVRELASVEPVNIESSTATLPVGSQLRGFATESDEDEALAALLDPEKQLISSDYFTHAAYDEHPEKRRKRGSLFFRKKKDKGKKSSHHWVSVCHGNPQFCDFCSKSLTNKPAVCCENCSINVHQNSCKDNIADCKGKGSKVMKSSSSFGKSSGKRGSTANQSASPSSQVHNDDDHHYQPAQHDAISYSDEVPLVSYEFLDEPPVTVNDLDTDPFLGLQDEEPDSWTPTVTKEVMKQLNYKEIKRQEHLYEFILTEKHHCLTLRVMQKVFVEGLQKYLQLGANVQRMFPRLVDLTEIHLGFLHKLRTRQKEAPVIECGIGDILESQFSGASAERLKSVYGEFCSNHRNAIDIYKDYMQHDTRFAEFVKHCQANPLLKKKGIPECILFVTQRLTKYPLLIDPLIKTTKDNKEEHGRLERSLVLVKEILVEVDAQVAEKEKEDRKLEIYNKLEAKSYTIHRGHKFKKSDILGENRKLRFEGIAMLMQGRGKMQVVLVIVFSDVLCFLLENNHKYSFFTPENKAGVVSLQKLLVREKAGQESRGIYLISSNPNDPEMFELKVHNPKDKEVWIKAIRAAVQNCPEDDEESRGHVLSAEEKQKQFDSKQKHIKEIVELLRQKDREQAQILEEKMALQLKLLATAGVENVPERPDYMCLVSEQLDNTKIRKDVLTAVKKVNQLAKSLYASATNLSRSASSVGERQSETYISPTLPKRAETFGGFDNQASVSRGALHKKQFNKETNTETITCSPEPLHKFYRPITINNSSFNINNAQEDAEDDFESPLLLMTGQDHQLAATQLSHHVYTLSCIISQQMTTIDSLEAELATLKSHLGDSGKPIYRHNQQLEELRNLQDKLQSEKEIWQRERDNELKELEQRREELLQLQEQIRLEQADITQQREKLYRKLETLSSQGIVMSPSLAAAATSPDDISWTNTVTHTPPSDPPKRKSDPIKWKQNTANKSTTLPLNLISATNQQKVASSVQIKQQLPLKLATKLGNSGNSIVASLAGPQQMLPLKLREGAGGDTKKTMAYQRLSTTPPQLPTHSRTGSSPAMMQNIQGESKTGVKAGRTNTYPKLPDKFRIRSSEANQETVPTHNTEEEVIFF